MARESMRAMLANVEHVGKPQLLENNTVRYVRPNGDNVVRLHRTDIIVKRPSGETEISSGGWKTITTADRIRRYSNARLISVRGVWYLEDGERRVPFEDGIVIGPNGELPTNVSERVASDQVKLGKAISKFVTKTCTGKLAQPGPGDCFFCSLTDQNGRAMGEGDPSHLLSHIEENYCPGWLLVRALRWAGHTETSIGHLLNGLGAPTNTSVKSALRRYLRRQTGLST